MHTITVKSSGMVKEIPANDGERLVDALARAGISIYAPCGGHGTCGKCKVLVSDGGDVFAHERERLTERELAEGWRLACMLAVNGDMKVSVPDRQAQILADALPNGILDRLDSSVRAYELSMKEPSLGDPISDADRLYNALAECGAPGIMLTLAQTQTLPGILRDNRFNVEVVCSGDALLYLGKPEAARYGVAVDIGTTTMAAYLIDISGDKARILGVASALNPQRAHGGDVITRSDFASQSKDNLDEMQRLVVGQIYQLTNELAAKAGIDVARVFKVVAVGNTTMMHFLLGLTTRNIAVSPFVPVCCGALEVRAGEIGLTLQNAVVSASPCVAGYVGADAVAAALYCGMDESDSISLMVDIGTNGEIVLGSRERLLCCSTAAGPALEGAHISCGMGGVQGAISGATLDGDRFEVTVIGGGVPTGICGSGLVDIIAALLDAGVIDEMGTFDFDGHEALCVEVDGREAVRVASGKSGEVVLTQRDIREVQLAKAAIAAGIQILMKELGCDYNAISALNIAGGFGNYIRRESAARIGLLPPELLGRMKPVGNAAGLGAQCMLISADMQERACRLAREMRYVELSARPDFQDLFVDLMMFE